MSEENRSPSEELRHKLDEQEIEYNVLDQERVDTVVYFDLPDGREVGFTDFHDGHTQLRIWDCTPEQAIAATVGSSTDLSKRLREVHGLHAFAELFGFDWTGESDWDWHDVACAMADAVDAETACEEHEMHICKRCGVAYELNIIDKGFGKSRFCPNCGHRRLYQ